MLGQRVLPGGPLVLGQILIDENLASWERTGTSQRLFGRML